MTKIKSKFKSFSFDLAFIKIRKKEKKIIFK